MSLIKCPNCNNYFTDDLSCCPKCHTKVVMKPVSQAQPVPDDEDSGSKEKDTPRTKTDAGDRIDLKAFLKNPGDKVGSAAKNAGGRIVPVVNRLLSNRKAPLILGGILIILIIALVLNLHFSGNSAKNVINEAETMAAGYDYDGAIELLKNSSAKNKSSVKNLLIEYEEEKAALQPVSADDVTHIFFHSLLVDPETAFSASDSAGYKQWMTTIDEFNAVIKTLYESGYVYVSMSDFIEETIEEDGTTHFKEKEIYLPAGKKPVVLSIDDLSYYYTYQNHGIASKLVIDESGNIACEYTDTSGNTSVGAYDCVPILNKFLTEHPDGAYHGARGIIALTGYNGVFGYRTDIAYKDSTGDEYSDDQKAWLENHADFDGESEKNEAVKIAEKLKSDGWVFASHTWGHLKVGDISLESLRTDTEKWKASVEPIIGETEMIVFAHGSDLAGAPSTYPGNEKYEYLKSQGFYYYFNVDSTAHTLYVGDEYVHQGRRNIDGYRLWNDAHKTGTVYTDDLFNASDILDPLRTDMPSL